VFQLTSCSRTEWPKSQLKTRILPYNQGRNAGRLIFVPHYALRVHWRQSPFARVFTCLHKAILAEIDAGSWRSEAIDSPFNMYRHLVPDSNKEPTANITSNAILLKNNAILAPDRSFYLSISLLYIEGDI
jgi:hypothetical protein